MKRFLENITLLLLSYAVVAFVIWDLNISQWDNYERFFIFIIFSFFMLIKTIIETSKKTFFRK